MPIYTVELDGKRYKIEGTKPPTEQETRMAVEKFSEERPRTAAEYFLPAGLTKYEEKPGERTLLGDIFERPGAAIRSKMMGKGYVAGALRPEEVPTFQETGLEKYYGEGEEAPSPAKVAGGFGVSAAGLAADIATDPATAMLVLFGLSPGGKEIMGKVGATKGVQALKRFGMKQRHPLPGAKGRLVQQEIKVLQKQFGLEPTKHKPAYLKTKLSELKREKGIVIKSQSDKVKAQAIKTIDDLKIEQKAFDNKLLKESTDFAKFMKDAGPKWVKKGTEKYGQLLDDISNSIGKETRLTAESVVNYLDDLTRSIEGRGLQGRILNDLNALKGRYTAEYPTNIIKFGELKTQMSSIYRQMSPQLKNGVGMTSDDAMIGMVKSKWMDFIGTVMPETEKAKFLVLQGKYRQFAEAKRAMGQAFHPYSGEYDMNKGINSALQFAEQRKSEGLNNLMKTLESGIDDYIPGVQDIKLKSQVLRELGKKKLTVKETIAATQKAKLATVDKLNKEKTAYVDEIFSWQKKADDLLSQKSLIDEQRGRLFRLLRNIGFGVAGFEAIRRVGKKKGQE